MRVVPWWVPRGLFSKWPHRLQRPPNQGLLVALHSSHVSEALRGCPEPPTISEHCPELSGALQGPSEHNEAR
eukprot:2569265-Alexandrium_andersonii.AAC.1